MKKIFPAYIVTFWSLYNLLLHFRKKRLKILKNVLSKNFLELLPQIYSSYRLFNFKNRLLLLFSLSIHSCPPAEIHNSTDYLLYFRKHQQENCPSLSSPSCPPDILTSPDQQRFYHPGLLFVCCFFLPFWSVLQ
jgi:hypothetical protein